MIMVYASFVCIALGAASLVASYVTRDTLSAMRFWSLGLAFLLMAFALDVIVYLEGGV